MNKKIISFVLCLTLLFGNLLPIASAEESNVLSTDDVFVENTESVTEPAETEAVTEPSGTEVFTEPSGTEAFTEPFGTEAVTEPSGTEAVTEPVVTTVPAETVPETQPDPTETDEEDVPAFSAPACDCGSQSALIIGHSDVCAMKQFYKDLCAGTASDIYALWNEIPKNAQAYIMTYLGYAQPETLKELVFLLASKWENESGLSGVAAAIKDGILFGAFGIPEDTVLQIKDAAAEAKSAIEAFVAQQENVGKELFTWDISVLNGEGISWQPDGSVRVELELPGEKLHKHTQVYVVHVDDEGNAEKIEAEVIDGNKIAFNTKGFSTFAGYTVDFEYNGVPFSIPGGSEILLSDLMDQLKMPFEVADVADVAFTNYDLISIEKQENDWLLTSLQAFQTEETLTITMTDGEAYEILVRDAVTMTWTIDTTEYGQYFTSTNASYYPDPNSNTDFTDGREYVVTIERGYYNSATCTVSMRQIHVNGGSKVVIQLGESFDGSNVKEVVLKGSNSYAMLYISNGSFELRGRAGTKIVLDRADITSNYPIALITNNATKLIMDHVKFRRSSKGAIGIGANSMEEVTITNCTFESTITNTAYNGGAVFVRDLYQNDSVATVNAYVDVHKFKLENCTFDGVSNTAKASECYYGGAVALWGKVYDCDILNCTFTDVSTTNGGGGAISLAGSLGLVDIQGCTFTNCTSLYGGGGIQTWTRQMGPKSSYSRINTLNITNCTFDTCKSTHTSTGNGGAIALMSQIHTVNISGSSFKNCEAQVSGGAINVGNYAVPNHGVVESGNSSATYFTAAMTWGGTTYGTVNADVNLWSPAFDKTTKRVTTIKNFILSGKEPDFTATTVDPKTVKADDYADWTFSGCVAHNHGGSIIFYHDTRVDNVSINKISINRSQAKNEGSAIYWGSCITPNLTISNSWVQNCDFEKDSSGKYVSYYPGGTIRTTGSTTIAMSLENCVITNNHSSFNGGGFYFNANNNNRIDMSNKAFLEKCNADIKNCLFAYNTTVRDGGGVYCESNMTVEGSVFCYNTARRGGGIAQQVYNNSGRMIVSGEVTDLTLDPNTKVYGNKAVCWTGDTHTMFTPDSETESYRNIYNELMGRGGYGGGISLLCNATDSIDNTDTSIPYSVTFQLNGAQVYNNTAATHGGGISYVTEQYTDSGSQAEVDRFIKSITIDEGAIYGNSAGVDENGTITAGNGGGIYMESGEPSATSKPEKSNTTLNITGGSIYKNTANNGNGGGVYLEGKYALCTITGGTIGGSQENANKATGVRNASDDTLSTGRGGGIAISGGATIDMKVAEGKTTGGIISYNQAQFQGGGIWLAAKSAEEGSVANSMTLAEGTIQYNKVTATSTTSANGGGVCVCGEGSFTMTGGIVAHNETPAWGGGLYGCDNAELLMDKETDAETGGQIYENSGSTGGGIALQGNAKMTIKYGSVYSNHAMTGGGGGILATGTYSKVTVEGGSIYSNTANSGSGGGIFLVDAADADITGGSIYSNTARDNGGGIYSTGIGSTSTSRVKVAGGSIYDNKVTGTSGGGGGICAVGKSVINVMQSDDGKTVGIITNNEAPNGGGIYLTGGADLTVNNGFVTYNKAVGNPSNMTTTYHESANLRGTGGGIYVADGLTNSDPGTTTFTLTGKNIAIYGNLADFAADDVFSNGVNTKLAIPTVAGMNLSEYKGNAKSWVEDYCIADTMYLSGTEGVLNQNSFVNGNNNGTVETNENYRYRGSEASKHMLIADGKLATAVNVDDAYVCMTLGVPEAMDDVYVVDYSVNLKIQALKNDLIIGLSGSNAKIAGAGMNYTGPSSIEAVDENGKSNLPAGWSTSRKTTIYDGIAGAFYKYNDTYVDYWLESMVFDKEVVFTYAAEYDGYLYFADITIIPATIVYYEDDAAAITYSTVEYDESLAKSDGSDGNPKNPVSTTGGWAVPINGHNPAFPDQFYQDPDRPGLDAGDVLGGLDVDSLYGYDSGYTNSEKYSWYSARRFTASKDGNVLTYGTVKFTFKGTGFDIISLTSGDTGTITVEVTGKSDNVKDVKKNYIVDTYYGYDANLNITTNTPSTLYQVPVIKANKLTYGEYDVVLTISYNEFFDHKKDGSYDFYLDSIRIYDPANDGSGNDVIQNAYVADKEGWPEYLELRNLLLGRKDFDNLDNNSGGAASGILFIDGKGNIQGSQYGSTAVTDYTNYGPNNEVYLQPGQSLAFNFELPATHQGASVASVQIGLKSVGGTAKVTCYGLKSGATTYALGTSATTSKSIATAADMYYDITSLLGKDIVIMNSGEATDAILSITNIKVTYTSAHSDYIENLYFTSTRTMATAAIRSIEQYYANRETAKTIDLIGASLSFEDEILTNLYYTTSNMAVSAEDMGLLTWGCMPDEVVMEGAEVRPGAVYDAKNDRYMVQTDGIAAKNLGDTIYMAVYAKQDDGTYVYSDVLTYSPKQYAMSRLENSSNEKLKALCVAMLNYGAAAQTHFGYMPNALANADLTAEQQALVSAYSADLFRGAIGANAAKIGEFAKTETGFGTKFASVSFESAFAINYYFAPTAAVDSDVTMYYWTADAYASADTLTAENASGALTMVSDGSGNYWAQISGIAAKQLDETYYVAAVYTSNGETFCTGVIAYSLSGYCMRNANGNMGELAQATAMYGYYAQKYFG